MASINDLEVDLSLKFPDEAAAAQLGGARITDNHDRYANLVLLQATLTNHHIVLLGNRWKKAWLYAHLAGKNLLQAVGLRRDDAPRTRNEC
jgi:hypothetical protein